MEQGSSGESVQETRGRLLTAPRWPSRLVLVRHGQSMGNLADADARKRNAPRLDLEVRDADVPLSDTGREQAEAVGRWLQDQDRTQTPDLVVSSPYRRAVETAKQAMQTWGEGHAVVVDERLRERDLGLFDGFTSSGIREQYPVEAERHKRVGKFYYQPPSGESWCDVILRVRSFLADLRQGYEGQRVWLFTHQAVIMSFRYVLEDLTEQQMVDVDLAVALPNCSLTRYDATPDGLSLSAFADTSAVDRAPEADVTAEPPAPGRGVDAG
jgi:broad specificity phosphatase PhoE